MPDATFDAIIVGGGNKALFTAIYLAKYAKMKVGIFERRHELGGGLGSHEAPAPGFIGDTHASTLRRWYYQPIFEDFPDFEEKGARFASYPVGRAIIMREDQDCFTIYHSDVDPDGERTHKDLVRFSGERDADTWMKILLECRRGGGLLQALLEQAYNPPLAEGETAPLERWLRDFMARPNCPIDRRWLQLPAYQAAQELFEHKGLVYMLLRNLTGGSATVDLTEGSSLLSFVPFATDLCYAVGGTHSIAHACQRIFVEYGGRFFTKSEVDRVLIENGRAKGVRLLDGTEVAATQLVVSGLDPHQLVFRLIGKEHLDARLVRRVENLQRSLTSTITWYTWAVKEFPHYRAADVNPDINNAHWVILGDRHPEYLLEEGLWRRLGKIPPGDAFVIFGHHSQFDPTRVPEGLHVMSSEEIVPPAYCLTEREWMKFKKEHAEKTLRVLPHFAPNMTWDKVIGYDAITPYDIANRELNMAPAGSFGVVDLAPGQTYPYRPTAELACHRTPILNLYATGAAWDMFAGNGGSFAGYSCYKTIAQDLDLCKPWQEKGRPY